MADTPAAHSRTPESMRSRSRPLSRSPPRWAERRGRSERRTSQIVVERVASERVAPAGNFPVLTKTNYYDWAALMRVMLQARGLWNTVIVGTTDYTKDRLALKLSPTPPAASLGPVSFLPSMGEGGHFWLVSLIEDKIPHPFTFSVGACFAYAQ
jgi:hypothetical protein